MQSIELLVYIIIAIIAAGSIIAVIQSVNYVKQYHDFNKALSTEKGEEYSIESTQLAGEIANRWEDCRYGFDNMSFSVYVKDAANITRESISGELLRLDKCDMIDCRNRTDSFFVAHGLQSPKIINIRCFNDTLTIS